MSKHADESAYTVDTEEVPEDASPTDPIVVPDTEPLEPEATDPDPAPLPGAGEELDPVEYEEEPDEVPVEPVEPSPEPPAEELLVSEGNKPVESIPVGSVWERAVTQASQIQDTAVRGLLLQALADQQAYSKDEDLRHRMMVADNLREMMRWIRTNIPSSASFQSFMAGVNSYLLKVETEGIPSMWSAEAASAPLDEIQARKAAMAIERAASQLDVHGSEDPVTTLKGYAQKMREGKIK